MEKGQVTFALQASGITGPVGTPMLLVCASLQTNPQQLVIYRGSRGELVERLRYALLDGPLRMGVVDELMARVDDELYTSLMYVKGIQAEFEGLP